MKILTEQMMNALRFYTGDVSWWHGEGHEAAFWQDKKAYLMINALFFEGIENELARAREKKFLNPVFLENTERLLDVCENLVKAMWAGGKDEPLQFGYRVERMSSFENMLQAGHTISPTSTSKAGFLPNYRDKKGLVLLDFTIEQGVPRVDMDRMLPSYSKVDEKEILIAPWLPLEIRSRPLTGEEIIIRDYDDQPPKMAYQITVKRPDRMDDVKPGSLDQAGAEAGRRVLKAILRQETPGWEDVQAYSLWKEAFRDHLKVRCQNWNGTYMGSNVG